MRINFGIVTLLFTLSCLPANLCAAPLAESFLIEGKLTEGAQTLELHLADQPKDDEARFGLGVIQFFLTFEHLGTSLYKHGLRTEDSLRTLPEEIRQVFPQNRSPEELSYQQLRDIVQTFKDDMQRAEKTLSDVKDPNVNLPLHVGQIKVDLTGQGKPVDAAFLLSNNPRANKEDVKKFVINFDRGDVDWLAGYCNFACAWTEVLLAGEGQQLFECSAHLFFDKVQTPHQFLMVGNRDLNSVRNFNRPLISDLIAFLHLWRFTVKEPERMQAALSHLEEMQFHAKSMWTFYQAETDDEREWIPNPQQTGVMQVKVSEEMLATWLKLLDETELILQGQKLVPFWRGTMGAQGVNFRKIFTEPTTLDPFLWWQGSAATPYLEEGPITDLATPEMLNKINETFGRTNFFRMAFWFN